MIGTTECFMRIAEIVKLRSGCKRRQVGAVFTINNRIVSTGFNQAPSGIQHCNEVGCTIKDKHCIRCNHAEVNGILNATLNGQTLKDASLYITTFPCTRCLMELRNAGVTRIIFVKDKKYKPNPKDVIFNELTPYFTFHPYG